MTQDPEQLVCDIHAAKDLGIVVIDNEGVVRAPCPEDRYLQEIAKREAETVRLDYPFPYHQTGSTRLKRLAKRVNKK